MSKIIGNGLETKNHLIQGLNQAADVITLTAGPLGRNVVIEQKNDLAPLILNDGVTIAQNISLPDPVHNLGASIVKQVSQETNEIAGDGTTTSVILVQKLINRAHELTLRNVNPVNLKNQITAVSEWVVDQIQSLKKEIGSDINLITHVASIASNNNTIGKLLAKAFDAVGPEGIINVEETQNIQSSLELSEGFKFKGGYLSRYMINDLTRNKVVLNNVKLLVYNQDINNLKPFIPLLERASQYKQPIMIVAKDFSDEVIATFALNKLRNVANIIAIKPVNYFSNLQNLLDDLAAFANTVCYSDQDLVTDWEALPSVNSVVVDKSTTTIIHEGENRSLYEKHLNNLKALKNNSTLKADVADLEKRIANLEAKVALIKVSGQSELEQKEKKYRIEDALNATRHAIESGVVGGGGVAFYRVYEKLMNNSELKEKYPQGVDVCLQALVAPISTIATNSGIDVQPILEQMKSSNDPWLGLDAYNNRIVNLWQQGIIDPYAVVYTAWVKAVSVACALITTQATIVDKVEDHKFIFPQMT